MNINHNNKITLKHIVLMTFPSNQLRTIISFNNKMMTMIRYSVILNRRLKITNNNSLSRVNLEISMKMTDQLREPNH